MTALDVSTVQRHAQHLLRQTASLLIYQDVLQGPIGEAFVTVLTTLGAIADSGLTCLQAYGTWFRLLAHQQQSWQGYLISQTLCAHNPFTRQVQQRDLASLPPALVAAARHDLRILHELHQCTAEQLSAWTQGAAQLDTAPIAWSEHPALPPLELAAHLRPMWTTLERAAAWEDALEDLAAYHRQFGAGLFAQYWAFRWQSGQLLGIAHPDPICLSDLAGYSHPRDMLLQNTRALLDGYPALHVLLYGSRGSGKSSLVKSLLHEFGDRGLRLVEVSKSELNDLPQIVDQLRPVPQKFVIFVDDLSFEEDDDAYKALKVVLEGNLTARPQNVVVYATSNRRHLIREFFGDRPHPRDADEIHSWDTVQEKLSFSDRFGLTLTFEPADQTTYLEIVHHLAKQADISLAPADLEHRALQWATQHNGRSGRTARQFIDFLRAQLSGTIQRG